MAAESDDVPKSSWSSPSSGGLPSVIIPSSPNRRKLSLSALQELEQIPRRTTNHGANEKHRSNSSSETSSRTTQELHDTKENLAFAKDSSVTCVVGSSVAGILYKWVNFGKGWRPRWFVLQDGVLSYYKVHGPNKITVNRDGQKGFRVIGVESNRFLNKRRNINNEDALSRKTSGKLHLKVSTIRKSDSDEKKFYIYTGTKTLHLRAETRDDRAVWFDSLQAAKDMFPKIPWTQDLSLPFEEITISTSKLKERLLQEGLDSRVITDCEKIVIAEFLELQDQLKGLQQNHVSLIERLRLLEADKVELETTVVDQQGANLREQRVEKDDEGSGSETDEDSVRPDGADAETDEDDDVYFDTKEALYHSSRSFTDPHGSASDSDDTTLKASRTGDPGMELVGFNYPYVKRRKRLPEPKEKERGVSLWSLIKDNIGKDLTKVCLPVYFNEPISSLQKCFEDLEYSYLLDRAYEWGRQVNVLLNV